MIKMTVLKVEGWNWGSSDSLGAKKAILSSFYMCNKLLATK